MNHSCGGCQYWTKLRKDMLGGGLCNKFDARVSSDDSCIYWKAIPYKRADRRAEMQNLNDIP